MDTKKLRQKILDLAIHGKLVPQDPNDEPASVLLERIKAEKERLIKEGKIKRSKKSAKTSDTPHYENVPFEVPSGWMWTTLSEVGTSVPNNGTFSVIRGGAKSTLWFRNGWTTERVFVASLVSRSSSCSFSLSLSALSSSLV